MHKEVGELEGALMHRGQRKLQARVNELLKPLRAFVDGIRYQKANLYRRDGNEVSISDAVSYLDDAINKALREQWETTEVKEFMAQVDNLQAQIDELKENIPAE